MRFIFYRKIKKKKKSIFSILVCQSEVDAQHCFVVSIYTVQQVHSSSEGNFNGFFSFIIPMDNIQSVCFRVVFRGGDRGAPHPGFEQS